MSGIAWEDPPPMERPKRDWAGIADSLRERPGEWARIAEYGARGPAAMMATRVSRSFYMPLRPAGTFEGTARRFGEGWAVYARYVGEAGS